MFDLDTTTQSDFKLTERCVGHEKQEQHLLTLFEQNSLPHAFIFSGPDGIGKSMIAMQLTKFLFKYGIEEEEGLFGEAAPREFSSLSIPDEDKLHHYMSVGTYADFLHIQREYDAKTNKRDATLKVEAIRKIEPFLRKKSSTGGWRVIIIEDAECMNRSAQNGLLKILEEPPENVMIILITHRIGQLITTIRSRSHVLEFDGLSQTHIQAIISDKDLNISAEQNEILSQITGGSVGDMVSFLKENGFEVFDKIIKCFGRSGSDIYALSNSLSGAQNDKQYRQFVMIVVWLSRALCFFKARDTQQLPSMLQVKQIENLYDSSTLDKLVELSDRTQNLLNTTERANLDRRDAVRNAFLMIHQYSTK